MNFDYNKCENALPKEREVPEEKDTDLIAVCEGIAGYTLRIDNEIVGIVNRLGKSVIDEGVDLDQGNIERLEKITEAIKHNNKIDSLNDLIFPF